MAARAGLVDIVRDFIAVHQRFARLFERFRAGALHFDEVRELVADSDASVLFRLKERVHGLFRDRNPELPVRRGEALFDLAVGSLFHEALKFRENLYQLEVYGPRVRALREAESLGSDELLTEFEKIIRAASDRLGESLRETETLLEQTRRQLVSLLEEAVVHAESSYGAATALGLVTRFLLEQRAQVAAVYPEGAEALLARVHRRVSTAYLYAVRSHLESAHFREAIALAQEGRQAGRADASREAIAELAHLETYARGMRAFLDGEYVEGVRLLGAWLESPGQVRVGVDLAYAVLRRLPSLVGPSKGSELLREARELATRLEKIGAA